MRKSVMRCRQAKDGDRSKMDVLIIDDAPELLKMYELLFSIRDISTQSYESARPALDFLQSCDESELPKVILVDLFMPDMTGEEFRSIQIANTKLRDIPTFLLSAQKLYQEKIEGSLFTGRFTKPVKIDELIEDFKPYLAKELAMSV